MIEEDSQDENYPLLQDNLAELSRMRLLNGKQLNIVELPMPAAVIYEDQRLPASYANFYIANESVIVPTYRCDRDERALRHPSGLFPRSKRNWDRFHRYHLGVGQLPLFEPARAGGLMEELTIREIYIKFEYGNTGY